MLARLRADDAHETRSTAGTPSAANVSLLARARRATDRAETLRITAHTEGVLDERKAALTVRALRQRRERIALFDLGRRADVRTARVDVNVETGIGQRRSAATGARDGVATPRVPGAPCLPLATRTRNRRADLDGAPAVKQRENGAEYKHSPESPAH